jgi:carboxyl-terminal processing protease
MRISVYSLLAASLVLMSTFARAEAVSADQPITAEYARKTWQKVDETVRKHFYDRKADATWKAAVDASAKSVLNARTMSALDKSVNDALHALHASHTQFVTPNDETYYFLKTLFAERGDKGHPDEEKIDYIGAVTGGVNCAPNEVRYVLDGSPAEAAGIKIGDQIVSVNSIPYIGQLSFNGTHGKPTTLKLKRGAASLSVVVKPALRNDYEAYIEAIGKSVRTHTTTDGKRIGYVHVWCGGSDKTHDAIEEALDKLQRTDALIFDLRDGYGGNFFDDLDYFYRNPDAYPPFTTIFRNGKKFTSNMVYSKPVVCLINGGSRSGKELLAYSLKKTRRATLVGENTAGAVLAGRLWPINEKAALYLAVAGGDTEGVVLEGKGVAPDVEIKQACAERGVEDKQYMEAIRILTEKLSADKQPAPKP